MDLAPLTVDRTADELGRRPDALLLRFGVGGIGALVALLIPAGPLALILSLVLLAATSWRIARSLVGTDALAAFGVAMIFALILVTAFAETLSLLGWLNRAPAWLAFQFVAWAAAGLVRIRGRASCAPWPRWLRKSGLGEQLIAVAFLVILATNLLTALHAGITEYDSVTTYVPYAIDFAQQPTMDLPPHPHTPHKTGVYAAPIEHFSNWHYLYIYTIVLGNTIVLLNFWGWVATVAGFAATLTLCRALRLGGGASLLATIAVFCAPQAVSQAANTMYDQAAGWVMAVTVLAWLRAYRSHRPQWIAVFAVAQASLPAVKLTAAFVVPIVLVLDLLLAWRLIARRRWHRLAGLVVIAGITAVALSGPRIGRIIAEYGSFPPEKSARRVAPPTAPNMAANFLLRNTKCLIPYESYHVIPVLQQTGPLGSALADVDVDHVRFSRGTVADKLLQHVAGRYIIAASYFGVLPLCMLILLLIATAIALARRRGRRLVLIAWLCLAAWLVFQASYAGLFRYKPWNGRYFLIAWFLAAPALAALLQSFRPAHRRTIALLLTAICLVEAGDIILHRRHIDYEDTLTLYHRDQFRRDPNYARSNIPDARRFLDDHHVRNVYTDLSMFFRLVYFDAHLTRRIEYAEALPWRGCRGVITDLSDDERAAPHIATQYVTFDVHGDIGVRDGKQRVALAPRGRPVSPRGIVTDDAPTVTITQVRVSELMGGQLEGKPADRKFWLGPRAAGSIAMLANAGRPTRIWAGLHVRRLGAAAPDDALPLDLWAGPSRGTQLQVTGPGWYLFPVELPSGCTSLRFVVETDAGPGRYYGDDRPAMLLVEDLIVTDRPFDLSPPPIVPTPSHFATVSVPDARLVAVDPGPSMGSIESHEGTQNAWLGPGRSEGLRLFVFSATRRPALLRWQLLQLGAGMDPDGNADFEIYTNSRRALVLPVESPKTYEAAITLESGLNELVIAVDAVDTGGRYGGDPRPTMAYITDVVLEPAHEQWPPSGE